MATGPRPRNGKTEKLNVQWDQKASCAFLWDGWAVRLLSEIAASASASAGRSLRPGPPRICRYPTGHKFWSSVPARLGAKDFEPVRLIQCEVSAPVW